MESGRKGIEIETKKRPSRYLLETIEKSEERWPKAVRTEEIRVTFNKKPIKWGKDVVKASN